MTQIQQSDGMESGEGNYNQPGNSNGTVAPGDDTLPLFPLEPSFYPLSGAGYRTRHEERQQQQACEPSMRVQQQQAQDQQARHQPSLIPQQAQVQLQAYQPAYPAYGMYNPVDNLALTLNTNSNDGYRQPNAQAHRNAQQQQQAWDSLRAQHQQAQAQQDHHQPYPVQQQQAQVPRQAHQPAYPANGMYNTVDNRGLTPYTNFNGGYRQLNAQAHHNVQQQQQAWEDWQRVQHQQAQGQQAHQPAYAANGMYNTVRNRGLTTNTNFNGGYRQPNAHAHHNAQQQQQQQAWEQYSLRVQHQQAQGQQAHHQPSLFQRDQAQVPLQAHQPAYAANGMYNTVDNRGLTPNMNSNGGYTGMVSASAPHLGQVDMQSAPNSSAQILPSEGGRTTVADRENAAEQILQRKIKHRESAIRSRVRKQARNAELEAKRTELKQENDRLKKELVQSQSTVRLALRSDGKNKQRRRTI